MDAIELAQTSLSKRLAKAHEFGLAFKVKTLSAKSNRLQKKRDRLEEKIGKNYEKLDWTVAEATYTLEDKE